MPGCACIVKGSFKTSKNRRNLRHPTWNVIRSPRYMTFSRLIEIIIWFGKTITMSHCRTLPIVIQNQKCEPLFLAKQTIHAIFCGCLSSRHSLIHTHESANMAAVQPSCPGQQRMSLTSFPGRSVAWNIWIRAIRRINILGALYLSIEPLHADTSL